QLGANCHKMRAILPFDSTHIDQSQIGFMDQRSGLQSMPRPFPSHVTTSGCAQLVIYKGNQFLKCSFIAATPGLKKTSHVTGSPGHNLRQPCGLPFSCPRVSQLCLTVHVQLMQEKADRPASFLHEFTPYLAGIGRVRTGLSQTEWLVRSPDVP